MTIINENPNLRMLDDYFPDWDYSEKDGFIIINGREYEYQINLSDKIADSQCCRVRIGRKGYFYFG